MQFIRFSSCNEEQYDPVQICAVRAMHTCQPMKENGKELGVNHLHSTVQSAG